MSEREVGDRTIDVSNLDKVFFPEGEVTKGDVLDHYERVAEVMLPHVGGRPLVLQRFPDGIEGQGFFQKNTPSHTPDWIDRVELRTAEGGSTTYSVVDDAAGLVFLANQGTVVFHTLLSEAAAPEHPVEVVFDLDPAGPTWLRERKDAGSHRRHLDRRRAGDLGDEASAEGGLEGHQSVTASLEANGVAGEAGAEAGRQPRGDMSTPCGAGDEHGPGRVVG